MTLPLGCLLSLGSSVLFGALYYLSSLLQPLSGTEVFGWRMLLTLPFVTLFIALIGEWRHVRVITGRLRERPALFPGLCLSSTLLAVQLWLFLWAPVNGAGVSVSVGYFLLPLTLLLLGCVVYRERLAPLQIAAALSAAVGVAHDLIGLGSVPWETAMVALGFPAYFALRRALRTDNLGGLWFDMLLMAPAASCAILAGGPGAAFAAAPRLFALLPVLAIVSAAAFVSYFLASRILPLTLFGLLGYVEPILLFLVALMLGEAVRREDLFTYVPILVAVVLLAVHGGFRLWRMTPRRSQV